VTNNRGSTVGSEVCQEMPESGISGMRIGEGNVTSWLANAAMGGSSVSSILLWFYFVISTWLVCMVIISMGSERKQQI